jgi:hypothetical protein
MKKGTFILLLLCGNLFFLGCKGEKISCPVALADLTINILTDVVTDVALGVPFSLLSLTKNIPEFVKDCANEKYLGHAGRFTNFVQINILDESSGTYIPCSSSNCLGGPFVVDGLDADQGLEEGYEVNFHEPGSYQVITITDYNNEVEESNESNNSDEKVRPRASDSEALSHGIFITVLPDRDYLKPEGAPRVEIRRTSMRFID